MIKLLALVHDVGSIRENEVNMVQFYSSTDYQVR